MKDSLGSEEWPQGTSSGKNTYEGPELLLGDNRKSSRESILACLPSKPLVDNLVDRYFTAIDASCKIILSMEMRLSADEHIVITHIPTFKKEVRTFQNKEIDSFVNSFVVCRVLG